MALSRTSVQTMAACTNWPSPPIAAPWPQPRRRRAGERALKPRAPPCGPPSAPPRCAISAGAATRVAEPADERRGRLAASPGAAAVIDWQRGRGIAPNCWTPYLMPRASPATGLVMAADERDGPRRMPSALAIVRERLSRQPLACGACRWNYRVFEGRSLRPGRVEAAFGRAPGARSVSGRPFKLNALAHNGAVAV